MTTDTAEAPTIAENPISPETHRLPLKVGVIGSCRVHVPLAAASKAGRIERIRKHALGYTHNPLETIQGIRLLKRQLPTPPLAILPLTALACPVMFRHSYRRTLQKADLVVCELSSIRIATLGGWHLQINLFRNRLKELGIKESDLPRRGSSSVAGDECSADILRSATLYEMTEQAIEKATISIRKILKKPTLFVGILTTGPEGGQVYQRTRLRDAITSAISGMPDCRFFDPTEFLRDHDFSAVMRDMGHYRDEFLPIVEGRLVQEINGLAQQG